MKIRWIYVFDSNDKENALRNKTRDKIKSWWKEFITKKDKILALLKNKINWDLPKWIRKNLQSINQNIMWEISKVEKGWRFIFTPESHRELRPLIKEILRLSPKIEGWEFNAYRLPEEFSNAIDIIKGRTGGDISDGYFSAKISDINKIDIDFFSNLDSEDQDSRAFNDFFTAIEVLCGEEILDKWIGTIEVSRLDDNHEKLSHIKILNESVSELIKNINGTLPEKPYFQIEEELPWTAY